MDDLNIIRAGIFFVGGILTILFRKNLNNIKNRIFKKNKDEEEAYYTLGVLLVVIAIILFLFTVIN